MHLYGFECAGCLLEDEIQSSALARHQINNLSRARGVPDDSRRDGVLTGTHPQHAEEAAIVRDRLTALVRETVDGADFRACDAAGCIANEALESDSRL